MGLLIGSLKDYRVYSTLTEPYKGYERYREVYSIQNDGIEFFAAEITDNNISIHNRAWNWSLVEKEMQFLHDRLRYLENLRCTWEELGHLNMIEDGLINFEEQLRLFYRFLFGNSASDCHSEFLQEVRTEISEIINRWGQGYSESMRVAKDGYVYLLEGNPGQYKIGLSQTPRKRIRKLGVVLPFPIETQHLISTDDMYKLEKDLHSMHSHKRLNGEWFRLFKQDIEFITSLNRVTYGGHAS